MAFCPNCGKPVDDNAKFCSVCGAVQTPKNTAKPAVEDYGKTEPLPSGPVSPENYGHTEPIRPMAAAAQTVRPEEYGSTEPVRPEGYGCTEPVVPERSQNTAAREPVQADAEPNPVGVPAARPAGVQQGGDPAMQNGYGRPAMQQGGVNPAMQNGYGRPAMQQGGVNPAMQNGYGRPAMQQGANPAMQNGYGRPAMQQGSYPNNGGYVQNRQNMPASGNKNLPLILGIAAGAVLLLVVAAVILL